MWVTGAHPTPEYPLPSQVVWGRVKLPYTALATLEHWNHRGAHPVSSGSRHVLEGQSDTSLTPCSQLAHQKRH